MSRRHPPKPRYEPTVVPTEEEKLAEVNRPVFRSFDEYVAAHPEAEQWREMYNGTLHFFLPCHQYYGCLPGHYVAAWVSRAIPEDAVIESLPRSSRAYWEKRRESMAGKALYYVRLNDGDDGYMNRDFDTREQAEAALEELTMLAPFHPGELKDFGYEFH